MLKTAKVIRSNPTQTVKIIFEDDYLLIINKPPFLAVTVAETNQQQTLEDFLRKKHGITLERSGIVHRLDKDTSGLLAVAKTKEVMEHLQKQFKEREVDKEYLALVHGRVEKAGRVVAAIMRNPAHHDKFAVAYSKGEGREAVTEYKIVKRLALSEKRLVEIFSKLTKKDLSELYATRYTLFTLLRCKPLTGRTHQIRVHLKYAGFPIVGDVKYGGRKISKLDSLWCPRQFLHAARLSFIHPVSGKRMHFESPLPKDLSDVLALLDKID